ncbi:MAG: M42 family metallopeptidase [Ignavibacteriales bacterium]
MRDVFEELEYLTGIPAPSGHEDRIISDVKERIGALADETCIDRLGNLSATFGGREKDTAGLLVFAHVDEIGLIVRFIEKDGYLRFERVGGVPEKTLRGQVVDVHCVDGEGWVTGTIGTVSHHLTPPSAKMVVPETCDMYIDTGLSTEELRAAGIDVGSMVTYHPNFRRAAPHRIVSKALDNRTGVYLLLHLAEHLFSHRPRVPTHLVFSVQEEFNVRGLLPVFERLRPTAAICLDITPASDTPDLRGISAIALGNGPAVMHMNFHGRGTLGGLLPNPKLRRMIEETARSAGIPFQREVVLGVITDDSFSQLTGDWGVAMAHLSIPIRYTHSPIETADVRDIEGAVSLLEEVVSTFGSDIDLSRGC